MKSVTIPVLAFLFVPLVTPQDEHSETTETSVKDFADTFNEYEVIYHRNYHLLLAMHGNDCYYVNASHEYQQTLQDTGPIMNSLRVTESSLLGHILNHTGVTSSSLEAVRDKYGDRLADYHCFGKNIFELDLFPVYMGCYQDEADRAIFVQLHPQTTGYNESINTPQYCVAECEDRGYSYAGMEYHNECFCGDSFDKHSAANESECNHPCKGDELQMCGGSFRLSVYYTGVLPFTSSGNSFTCSDHPDGLYLFSESCSQYVHCIRGIAFLETCRHGRLFSSETGQCLDNALVIC